MMSMVSKAEFIEAAWSKFNNWQIAQENQVDGFQFEKSFDKMMVETGKSLLQKSMGSIPKTPSKKKEDQNSL